MTDASLLGPFDGVVVDADTGDPIAGATVVAIWAYDQGDGFIGPGGSEVVEVISDTAGRYRIPAAPSQIRGKTVRLVSFDLVVYERGYVGYRSGITFDGRMRKDFYGRQNEVRLRKWRSSDSHAQHLLYLAAPRSIAKLAEWERDPANLDLYRSLGGEVPGDAKEDAAKPSEPAPSTREVLDASGLLSPDDVRRRTGYTEAFEVKDLGDLSREPFYHGVHFEAIGHDEPWDLSYRVWRKPPGGLDSVRETFDATLPGVKPSAEVTPLTWLYEASDVLAVAFLEPEREIGVLMTCGVSQCADIETVIILARLLYEKLDALALVPVEAPSPEPATALPEGSEPDARGSPQAPGGTAPAGTETSEPGSPGPVETPEPDPTAKPPSDPSAGGTEGVPAEPTPSKPEAAAPKPAPTKPTPSKPAPSKPAPSKPAPPEPAPSEPTPSKPAPSKPESAAPPSGPRQSSEDP